MRTDPLVRVGSGRPGLDVDISTVFTEKARARAAELGVAEQVTFVHGDASGPAV
nr:hypothetical protein [Actinopolyspora erythraea]